MAARRTFALARRGLSQDAYAGWLDSLATVGSNAERVLAWAGEPGGDLVIGTRGRLSALSVPAEDPAVLPAWAHVGWHRLERGSWDGDAHRLVWADYDGTLGAARLPVPGRVPELFRERIAASIAVEEIVQIGGGRSVVISGRRDLADPDGPLEWQTSLSRGLSWQQPGLRALAEDTLARLRSEYGHA